MVTAGSIAFKADNRDTVLEALGLRVSRRLPWLPVCVGVRCQDWYCITLASSRFPEQHLLARLSGSTPLLSYHSAPGYEETSCWRKGKFLWRVEFDEQSNLRLTGDPEFPLEQVDQKLQSYRDVLSESENWRVPAMMTRPSSIDYSMGLLCSIVDRDNWSLDCRDCEVEWLAPRAIAQVENQLSRLAYSTTNLLDSILFAFGMKHEVKVRKRLSDSFESMGFRSAAPFHYRKYGSDGDVMHISFDRASNEQGLRLFPRVFISSKKITDFQEDLHQAGATSSSGFLLNLDDEEGHTTEWTFPRSVSELPVIERLAARVRNVIFPVFDQIQSLSFDEQSLILLKDSYYPTVAGLILAGDPERARVFAAEREDKINDPTAFKKFLSTALEIGQTRTREIAGMSD